MKEKLKIRDATFWFVHQNITNITFFSFHIIKCLSSSMTLSCKLLKTLFEHLS